MKKLLIVIAAAVLIVYPSICFASYVIHLKDGREFVTDRYWEEGDQIKLNVGAEEALQFNQGQVVTLTDQFLGGEDQCQRYKKQRALFLR